MPSDKLELERKAFQLLEESARLSKEERLAYIEKACTNDENLLRCCHSLLDNQMSDEDFMALVYDDPEGKKALTDGPGKVATVAGFICLFSTVGIHRFALCPVPRAGSIGTLTGRNDEQDQYYELCGTAMDVGAQADTYGSPTSAICF